MRCKRCWKKLWENTIHTCVPYQHYKGITWTATRINWESFDFIVDEVSLWTQSLIFKITSWEQKEKYSFLYFDEIDNYIKFNVN